MNVYMTEEEQLQQVTLWIKKYGLSVIAGIVIALLGSFGWRYWQQSQQVYRQRASSIYEQLLISQASNQLAQMNQFAGDLMMDYARTPYAAYAALALASTSVAQNNLLVAEQNLQWASKHAPNSQIKNIAKLRAARVLLAQKKPDQALQLLQTITDKNFLAATKTVIGDSYMAINNVSAAKSAYQQALNAMSPTASMRGLVQMKLDNLS